MNDLIKKLNKIQKELSVPKSQWNKFGNYYYRNCEDILEAVKPLLDENTTLTIQDEIVMIGDRYYVKATAKLRCGAESTEGIAYARESDEKKGMDSAQITGAASSYARKYALNGLFLIDDTKDSDGMDNTKIEKPIAKTTTKPSLAKDLLKVKVSNALKEKKLEPTVENTKSVIQDHAGLVVPDLNTMTEQDAKNIISLWS